MPAAVMNVASGGGGNGGDEWRLSSGMLNADKIYIWLIATGVLVSAMIGFLPMPLFVIAGVVPIVRIVDNLVG